MRVAIISDVHGNAVGLEAVLADIRKVGVDRIICLGDLGTIGPRPAECIDAIRDLSCPVVMGNVDYYLFHEIPEGAPQPLLELFDWCRERLTDDHIDYLRTLVPTHAEGDWLLCCHGSPKGFDDWIVASTPEEEFEAFVEGTAAPMIAGGHTHQPMVRQFGNRVFLNPGSVGLPFRLPERRALSEAEYAIVGPDSTELRRVPFDLKQVSKDARAVGLPHHERWSG
ncbi:MAG: metallophosphoesterase family protein [Gammaproteobacteria bacterium]|nr:metallophosphoesterase family protein [Gammaproteobacteria bacterium]